MMQSSKTSTHHYPDIFDVYTKMQRDNYDKAIKTLLDTGVLKLNILTNTITLDLLAELNDIGFIKRTPSKAIMIEGKEELVKEYIKMRDIL